MDAKKDFSRWHNLLLPSRLLLGNLVPDELYLAVFHLLLVDLDVLLQMIASGECLGTVEAFIRFDA